ncbi:MAG: glutathione S-transferase family protein [Kofleriaceae bacterium]
MTLTLFHHPYSRAAGTLWALEEVGAPYELRFVDMPAGVHKGPELVAKNPMGKLPTLTDGELVVTESAAIALYLADRYAPGRLAPALDDPRRGTYLRWSLFAPSVIEPGLMAKAGGWAYKAGQAGWGEYESMLRSMEAAVDGRDFVLGAEFSMADVIFGGTVRYMLRFGMLEARPAFAAYVARLDARPASQRADAKNKAIAAEHGLKM